MDKKALGHKLKMARIDRGYTQDDLANAINIKQKSVSRYENGKSIPDIETLEKICIKLKKSFGFFLNNEDQNCSCIGCTGAITHWMPLPTKPKEKINETIDCVTPPPWELNDENREISLKYHDVMMELKKYGYTLSHK